MKWLGWILKLCVTIVAVSLLTVATTGYVVNSYIQSLMSSYNLPITGQAPGFGGIMKGMLGFGKASDRAGQVEGEADQGDDANKVESGSVADANSGKTEGDSADSSGAGGESDRALNGTTTETSGNPPSESTSKDANETDPNGDAPEDALPVMGGMSAGDALGEDQQVVVTPDDLVAKKEELPDKQKEEIFAILMKKLPQEEMQILTVALEGGLTETEMMNIEQMLSKHLDKTEYAKVMELLKK